jgi:acyl carrier protein
MSASENLYGRVAKILSQSLNVDEEDLKPTATLQGDLGAESIDFLDIVFRLEREFAISIPRSELFPESVFQGNPELVQEGKVTDLGIGELRSRMPYADLSAFDKDRRVSAVTDLFTVGLVVGYVAWKLEQVAGKREKEIRALPVTQDSSTHPTELALAATAAGVQSDCH